MENLTTESATCIASVYVYGKSIAVTCHILISALLKSHLLLFDRLVLLFICLSPPYTVLECIRRKILIRFHFKAEPTTRYPTVLSERIGQCYEEMLGRKCR